MAKVQVPKARRLNPRVRYPVRRWIAPVKRYSEPRLRRYTKTLYDAAIAANVPARFQRYLKNVRPADFTTLPVGKALEDEQAQMDTMLRNAGRGTGLTLDLLPLHEDMFEDASRFAFQKLGFKATWNLDSSIAQATFADRANKLVGVEDTMFRQISDTFRTAIYEQGKSPVDPALLDKIQTRLGKATQYEAERIARTEVNGVVNTAQNTVYRENGVNKKGWLYSQSGYERHEHLDGEEVDMEETFSNGLMYPGDPSGEAGEVINCLCTQYPVVDILAIDDWEVDGMETGY